MTYVVLGASLVLLEVWTLASPREGGPYALPQAIRLLMPVLMAIGAFRRRPAERIPVGLLAVAFGLVLNRDLTGNPIAARVAVIACASLAAWLGYSVREKRDDQREKK